MLCPRYYVETKDGTSERESKRVVFQRRGQFETGNLPNVTPTKRGKDEDKKFFKIMYGAYNNCTPGPSRKDRFIHGCLSLSASAKTTMKGRPKKAPKSSPLLPLPVCCTNSLNVSRQESFVAPKGPISVVFSPKGRKKSPQRGFVNISPSDVTILSAINSGRNIHRFLLFSDCDTKYIKEQWNAGSIKERLKRMVNKGPKTTRIQYLNQIRIPRVKMTSTIGEKIEQFNEEREQTERKKRISFLKISGLRKKTVL